MTRFRTETIGDATLILGDCREVLPTLTRVDAVVTDPPYGLGDKWQGGNAASKGSWKLSDGGAGVKWDVSPTDALPLVLGCAPHCIIWGGNYYALPPQRGWLLWDKKQGGDFTSGHAELAWSTLDQPVRAFRMSQVEAYCGNDDTKRHPTQKPTQLMEWCLGFLPNAPTILDPFMGSGTTGVACIKLGRKFIGIEIEPKYFDIACRRIEEAWKQPRLFDEPRAKPVQEALIFD